MNHETDDSLFEKYMDGALDASAQAEFEAHIKNCPACAEKYADFIKIRSGLSSIGDEPLPDGFTQKWTAAIHAYGRSSKKSSKQLRRVLPAIAAGVAVVAVISAVMLSGVLSPGAALPEAMLAGSAGSEAAADTDLQDSAAKNAAGANEAMPAPETESSASLFMMQEAPMESAAPADESPAAEADRTAVILTVTQETFDALADGLAEQQTEYSLDDGQLIFTVTEENKSFFADFSERYALDAVPLAGETYEVRVAG